MGDGSPAPGIDETGPFLNVPATTRRVLRLAQAAGLDSLCSRIMGRLVRQAESVETAARLTV